MTAPPSLDTARYLIARLKEAGHEAYLVGGCVRDLLRGVEPEDYDIATSARPEEVQRIFPRTVPIGASFGVILVLEKGRGYEVATFRADLPYLDGRRPSGIAFASAREDVLRRDFTINGLLMDPVTGEISDYTDGRLDIEKRVIRAIGSPRERFAEDHLRMLRAVRLASNLDFDIAPDTLAAIEGLAEKILLVSAERIREEMTKLLAQGLPRKGLELLDVSGLLNHILPEVSALKGIDQPGDYHPEGDVWEHTLRMLALLPQEKFSSPQLERLAWAVLFHDIGKAATRSEDEKGVHFFGHVRKGEELARDIMHRLRFSNETAEAVLALIHHHMYFLDVPKLRPAKLKRFLRLADFDLHLALHRLDCLGSHGRLETWNFCRESRARFRTEELHPPKLLTGRDLMELGFKPGPLFQVILDALEDAQLEREVADSEEARRFVLERYGQPGR